MALYEHVVISRQDISPQQAEALNDQLKSLIEQGGGVVAKIEYWGLRNLSLKDVTGAIVSSVVPQLSHEYGELGPRYLDDSLLVPLRSLVHRRVSVV